MHDIEESLAPVIIISLGSPSTRMSEESRLERSSFTKGKLAWLYRQTLRGIVGLGRASNVVLVM